MLETLRKLRKSKGLTMKDVASEVGVSEATMSLYERGLRSPSYEVLLKLGEYFGVSVDFLLSGSDPKAEAEKSLTDGSGKEENLNHLVDEINSSLNQLDSYVKMSFEFVDNMRALLSLPPKEHKIVSPRDDDFLECMGDAQNEMAYIIKQLESYFESHLKYAPQEEKEAFMRQYDSISKQLRVASTQIASANGRCPVCGQSLTESKPDNSGDSA